MQESEAREIYSRDAGHNPIQNTTKENNQFYELYSFNLTQLCRWYVPNVLHVHFQR